MCPRTKFEGTYEVVNIKFPRATIIDSAWDRRVLLSLLSNTKFWARKYRHSHASSINDKLHCDTENFKNERHTSCQLDKIFNIYCCSTHEDWIIRIKTAVTVVLKLKMFQKWKHTHVVLNENVTNTLPEELNEVDQNIHFSLHNPCDVLSKPSLYRLVYMISILKYWKAPFWQWNTIQDLFLALHFQFSSSLSRLEKFRPQHDMFLFKLK